MRSTYVKPLLFTAWPVAVSAAAFMTGVSSFPSWILVAGVATVPPVVVGQFWRRQQQTTSEAIRQARA